MIFIHGCFWHGHNCARGAAFPKTTEIIRVNKIAGNTLRDRSRSQEARDQGLGFSLVIWECHVGNAAKLETKVREFLRGA